MNSKASITCSFAAFLIALLIGAPSTHAQTESSKDTLAGLPLAPSRTLRFTTDEGTWMSLDVSSDGTRIAFDLLGDLYTMPIGCPRESTEGCGPPTRITSGMAYDAQPRFSPDDRRIVFVSDRSGSTNVWTMGIDGSDPQALTNEPERQFLSPIWTADGTGIIVTRRNWHFAEAELRLYALAGGTGLTLLAKGSSNQLWGPALSPDGRYLYHTQTQESDVGDPQVARLDRTTGLSRTVTSADGGGLRPAVSHNGRMLVYGSRQLAGGTGLIVRNLRTGDERWLADDVQWDSQESWGSIDQMPGYAFTPDDRALILSYAGKIWRVDVASGSATRIPFRVEVEQQLGPLAKFEYPLNDTTVVVRQIRHPRLSPDGSRLAFSALSRIWITELSSGATKRLTRSDVQEVSPAWSSDGRWIAYTTWDDTAGGAVLRSRSDGSGTPERVTTVPAFYRDPAFTPDGKCVVFKMAPRRIAFAGGALEGLTVSSSHEINVAWAPATGGDPTPIAPIDASHMARVNAYGVPHFVGGDERIYYMDKEDGVVSVRWDGTDRREELHVKQTVSYQVDTDIQISPKGDRALAIVKHQLYLLTLPTPRGPLPDILIDDPSSAPIPVRRVTRDGADYAGWTPDGRGFYYSLGASFYRYDLTVFEKDSTYQPTSTKISISVPADRPEGTVVLRGARIITMKGDEVLERGDIVVTRNRIVAVGPAGGVTVPPGAKEIDVTGKTIIPGWVDIHAHSMPSWGPNLRTQTPDYLANLAYGVTTMRDPSTSILFMAYGDEIDLGRRVGPRLFGTGPAVNKNVTVRSREDMRNELRRYAEHWRTETVKEYMVGDREHRQWFVMAAHELGLTPTNEGASMYVNDITFAIDGYAGLEHNIPIVPLFDDVVQLFARSGITYTPTLAAASYGGAEALDYWLTRENIAADPKFRRFQPVPDIIRQLRGPIEWRPDDQFEFSRLVAEGLRKIVAAGGRVALGSHGNMQGLGVHFELWTIARGGMPNHDVLRVGTIFGAEAIGHAKDIGSIEPGKLADLQVLDGNPLEDIRNTNTIRYVMKNGRVYDANTLDEIWPRQRKLPTLWWLELDPFVAGH